MIICYHLIIGWVSIIYRILESSPSLSLYLSLSLVEQNTHKYVVCVRFSVLGQIFCNTTFSNYQTTSSSF